MVVVVVLLLLRAPPAARSAPPTVRSLPAGSATGAPSALRRERPRAARDTLCIAFLLGLVLLRPALYKL